MTYGVKQMMAQPVYVSKIGSSVFFVLWSDAYKHSEVLVTSGCEKKAIEALEVLKVLWKELIF